MQSIIRFAFLSTCLLVPVAVSAQKPPPAPPRATTWEEAWDAAWARANAYYAIRAADTVATDPACQGDLGFSPRVKELTRAVAARKYGDATRLIATIHDKSLCLSLEGTRGLEYAFAGYLHRAMTALPAAEAETAVHGILNVGMLVFDALQYTRRSYWLPAMKFHNGRLAPIVSRYPKADLGFFLFDWSRGALVAGPDPVALAASMRDFANYGDGTCSLLEMSRSAYVCKGWIGKSGGGSGATGKLGSVGGLPSVPSEPSGVACVVEAARSTGARGQLGCAAKATGGMTIDPRGNPKDLLSKGLAGGQPGVRDPHCALSQDAGGTGGNTDPAAAKKEPTKWETIKEYASKAKDILIDVFVNVFDKTPPIISDLKPLASTEGADAERGVLQMLQEQSARDALLTDDGADKYYQQREGRVTTDPQAGKDQRTADPFGGGGPLGNRGGGSCGRGSNAARRAHALYDCITGGTKVPAGSKNPLVSLVDPGQVQTPMAGALACVAQGGDLPRQSFEDPRCKTVRCAPGALSCPCDRAGGGALPQGGLTPRLSASTSPNCANGECDPLAAPAPPPKPQGTGPVPRGGPTPGVPTPPPGGSRGFMPK